MKFRKKLYAIASAMIVMFSANAYAAVDMTNAANAVTFAQELVPGPATALTNAANALDATSPLGFSIAAGTSKYVRFDLSNGALFGAVPTYVIAHNNSSGGGAGNADSVVLSSGGNGTASVIFEVGDSVNGIDPTAVGTMACAAYTAANSTSSVTLSYAMYDTAGEAVNQTNSLSTQSTTFVNYSTGILITEDTTAPIGIIDVTNQSMQFTVATNASLLTSRIGDVNILVDTTVRDPADGAVLAAAADEGQFLAADAGLTLTGDFTATQNADGTYTGAALNRVYIDNDGGCDNVDTAAASISATQAVITTGANEVAGAAELCFVSSNVVEIQESTFTADFSSGTGGTLAAPSTMTLETFTKNGASDTVNFLLKPTAAFTNLVRISNSGSVAGDVFLTLISDAGTSVRFELADVAGYSSSTLASGASTAYITITDLYAAAQAADATFDNNGGQLRLNVDSTCTEIIVNAFAMSKDNNVFTVIDSVDNASN